MHRSVDEMLAEVVRRAGRKHRARRVSTTAAAATLVVGLAAWGLTSTPKEASRVAVGSSTSVDAPASACACGTDPADDVAGGDARWPDRRWPPDAEAGGFVAAGQGYDNRTNQGRVWFSPDGITWTEPAPELFHPLQFDPFVAQAGGRYAVVARSGTGARHDIG